MIVLAGRNEVAGWVVHRIADQLAAYIGERYAGMLGALLASIAVYYVFKLIIEPKLGPTEREINPDALDRLNDELASGLSPIAWRLGLSLLIGLCGPIILALVDHVSPGVQEWAGNRGPTLAWLVVATVAFVWFYRSLWRSSVAGFGAILGGFLFLKFGTIDYPLQWLFALGLVIVTIALFWIYRTPWKIGIVAGCAIAMGFYLLDRKIPLGAIGVALMLGGTLYLMLASPGVSYPPARSSQ